MDDKPYITEQPTGGVPIKMWTRGVPVEDEAKQQLANAARLPIVFKYIAAMPDVHFGIGATVGSVIPTVRAIIPAAVGVDIGCGMIACKTTLRAEDLPDNLAPLRAAIERAVPHGRAPGARPCGTARSIAERSGPRLTGRSSARNVVFAAIIPQPMSTPTAAGMMAFSVGITEPTVAPMP